MVSMECADKPFHESIVDAIVAALSYDDFAMLARLIRTTKIPKDHDLILAAWRGAIDKYYPDSKSVLSFMLMDFAVPCLTDKMEQARAENESVEVMFGSLEPGDPFPNPVSGFKMMKIETEPVERGLAVYLEGPLAGRRVFFEAGTKVWKKVGKGK